MKTFSKIGILLVLGFNLGGMAVAGIPPIPLKPSKIDYVVSNVNVEPYIICKVTSKLPVQPISVGKNSSKFRTSGGFQCYDGTQSQTLVCVVERIDGGLPTVSGQTPNCQISREDLPSAPAVMHVKITTPSE